MATQVVAIPGGRPPENPGVYLMKNTAGAVIYVGKAVNLRRRVESYFQKAHDSRIEALVRHIADIEYQVTDTAVEALLLEAELIKKYRPKFNIREKDDKSFLCVAITRERFPRVLMVRGKEQGNTHYKKIFGPFPSSSQLREAMKIIRRIFPWNTHAESLITSHKSLVARKPCFDAQLHLCPGTCTGTISVREYAKTVRHIILFLEGKKERVVNALIREMETASKKMEFEKAALLKGKIFALKHIQDVALIGDSDFPPTSGSLSHIRIEGYDISNISGTSSVASMVVFVNGRPAKEEYRKFRMRSEGPNPARRHPLSVAGGDVGMIQETILRRFNHKEWSMPNLVVVDGGVGQIRAAREAIRAHGMKVPVIGIAKGPERKRNDIIGILPKGVTRETIIKVRDESHRFAIKYHKHLRGRNFLPKL